MAAGDILHVAGNLHPSRHAAKFIATEDQAVVIDAFAIARVAAGDTEGTFSAWVNIPDITGDYGIISCGNSAAIEFVTLRVTAGKLVVELNDATADRFEHTSTNVVIIPHRWHHVAVAQNGYSSAPKLYVDGEAVAQTVTLATNNTLWFGTLSLMTDDASIGAAEEAGAAAQIREFKGGISDVKYWSAELTAEQVKSDYLGQSPSLITGTVADLISWWDMKDDYIDSVAGHDGAAGASIHLCSQYSEFTSRMVELGQVVADDICISVNDKEGHCIIVKAA